MGDSRLKINGIRTILHKTIQIKIPIFIGLLIILITLIAIVLLQFSTNANKNRQIVAPSLTVETSTNTPTPQSTSTPVSQEITNILSTQQIQIDELQRNLSYESKERDLFMQDINNKFNIYIGVFTIIVGIFTFIGYESIKDFKKTWKNWTESELRKEVNKIDIDNLDIFLPEENCNENIERLLKTKRFKNIKKYYSFEEISQGILIVCIPEKDPQDEFTALENYIIKKKPQSKYLGIIVYSPKIQVPKDLLLSFDNIVAANFPATAVSNIFSVARGIEIPLPEEKEGK